MKTITLFEQLISELDTLFSKDPILNASFGKPSKLIKSNHKGFCIDGKRFLDLPTSRKNLCVVAGSGKGKTQTHIFPTLLHSDSSMVVNDNSGELASVIPYLISKGATPLVLNLSQKTDVYLNPLDGCKGDRSAIRKIAKTLMSGTSTNKDFFSLSGEDCLSLFIEYVLECEPRLFGNLGNVYRLLLEYQANPKVVERLFASRANEEVWTKFLALSNNSERTLKSITATALSALSWLGDNPVLCDITSVTNLCFEDFRSSQHVLFIQSPVSDTAFYAPMVALVFQSFYRFAFSGLPSEKDLDILMILDEFSTLIKGLPDYAETISNSRKFNIPQAIILQDESQLSHYKELKGTILMNCFTKVYYGGQDDKAFALEKLLGNIHYEDKKSKTQKTRPLLTATQIREMDEEVLVIPSGQKPLKVKITPAYKQARLRKKMAMEQVEYEEDKDTQEASKPITYSIQYIDLDPFRDNALKEDEV